MNTQTTLRTVLIGAALACGTISLAHAGHYGMGGMMMGNSSMGHSMMQQDAGTSRQAQTSAGTALTVEGSSIPDNHQIVISVLPDAKIGPDQQRHTAIVPTDYVVHAGQAVTLKIVNNDLMPHTITSPELGTSVVIAAARRQGSQIKPTLTTYRFTPKHKGVFRWFCVTPCDQSADGWAMTTDFDGRARNGYMAGYFYVV